MVLQTTLDLGTGFVRGDKFSITRTLTGIPVGRTIAEAWLTVKDDTADVDASAIFQKIITSSNVTGTGHIVNTGSNGIGQLRFDLSSTNTEACAAGTLYYYDIQIRYDNNDIITVETGTVKFKEQVTRDT